MALRILTPGEMAPRVAEIRRRLGMGSVEMSLALGQDKQFISRMETGKRKRIERWELGIIAEYAAGKGDFKNIDAHTILHFLEGEFEWDVRLRPNHLRPVDGGGQAQDTTGGTAGIGYFRQTPIVQDIRALRDTG